MVAINLPDLVQKVKVDTSSMALASRRATAMGAKFKQAERDVTSAQKNMDRSMERSKRLMKDFHDQQSKVARGYQDLGRTAKGANTDIEQGARGIKAIDRVMGSFSRTAKIASQNLRSTTEQISDLGSASTKATASVEGIGSGMSRASRRTKQFKRDANEAGNAVRDIPSLKDVSIEVSAKGVDKAKRELDKLVRERDVEIDAKVANVKRFEKELSELTEDQEVEIEAKVTEIRKANAEIGELVRERDAEVEVVLKEIAKAEAQLDNVARDRTATIHTDVDQNSAQRSMGVLDTITQKIDGVHAAANGNAGGGRGGGGFGGGHRGGIFSSMISGMVQLGASVPIKIFDAFGDSLSTFQETFSIASKSVTEGGKGLGKIAGLARAGGAAFSALAGSASMGVAAVALVVPVLVGVSAAFGALAAAISLTGGMLTAFVGIIGTAIIAPLLTVIPLITAFGAGALVAGGAIAMWAKKSDALKNAIKPVKAELQALAKELTPTLDGLTKLFGDASVSMIRSFGDNVKRVLDDFYLKLKDPSMQQFYDKWNVSMPRIFESLGKAISSFSTGLIAFFVPILPYVERLSNSIKGGADRFNAWATSAKGQNAIADWMREAWDISKKLWSGLKDIGGAILDVMGIGVDESGGDFATWVRDIGRDFRKWTESEQGRKDIKKWFEDAERLAKDVKDIIKDIAEAFDTLDSPEGRAMLRLFMDFIKLMTTHGENVAKVMNAINRAFLMMQPPNIGKWFSGIDWGAIGTSIKEGLLGMFPEIGVLLSGAGGKLGQAIITGIKKVLRIASPSQAMVDIMLEVGSGLVQGLMSIPGMVIGLAMSIGRSIISGIGAGLSTIGTVFMELPGRIMGALSGLGGRLAGWATTLWTGVSGPLASGAGMVVSFFMGVPGRIMGALGGLGGRLAGWASRAWSGVTGAFSGAVGATVSFFVSVPGRLMGGLVGLGGRLGGWASGAWSRARGAFGAGIAGTVSFFVGIPGRLIGAVVSLGGRLGTWASGAWSRARGAFGAGVSGSVSFFSGVPGRIIGAVSSLGGRFGTWASGAWSRARSAFGSGVGATVSFMSGVPGRIIGVISSLGGRLSGWANTAWNNARNAFSNGVGNVVSVAGGLPGRVLSAIGSLGSILTGAGRDLIQGFLNGMNERINSVVNAAGGMASRVAAEVKAKLDSHSPSRVMIAIGQDTGKGFEIGVAESMAKAAKTAGSSVGNVVKKSSLGAHAAWAKQLAKVRQLAKKYKGIRITNDGSAKWTGSRSAPSNVSKAISSLNVKQDRYETAKKRRRIEEQYISLLKKAIYAQRDAVKKQAAVVQKISTTKQAHANVRYGMEHSLKMIKQIGQKIGTGKTIPIVEAWYADRKKVLAKQDKQMLSLTRNYEKRKALVEERTAKVKEIEASRKHNANNVKGANEALRRLGASSMAQSTGSSGSKNVNVNITNNNPVAEKSSKTAIRNLTNIAQLVNW